MALSAEVDVYNLALGYVGIENPVASTTENSAEAKLASRFYDPCLRQLLSGYDWPWAQKVSQLSGGFKLAELAARTSGDGVINSTTTFTSANADFVATDVGRYITIVGADGSTNLVTTIHTVSSENTVILADVAADNESSKTWTIHGTTDLNRYPWTFKYDYPSDCLTPRYVVTSSASTPLVGEERIPFEVLNYYDRKVFFTDENQAETASDTPVINLAYTKYETTTSVWPIQFDHALATLLASNLAIPLAGEGSLRDTLMNTHRIYLAECVSQSMDMRDRGPEKNNDVELVETRFN